MDAGDEMLLCVSETEVCQVVWLTELSDVLQPLEDMGTVMEDCTELCEPIDDEIGADADCVT